MNAVRILTRIDSTTLVAPEFSPLIGKRVEVVVDCLASPAIRGDAV